MKLIYMVFYFCLISAQVSYSENAKVYNTRESRAKSNWMNLLDPTKKDFYIEGTHVPDEGFILFATNPTIENAKRWILRNELKAKRLRLMMKLVDEANIALIKEGQVQDHYGVLPIGQNQTPHLNRKSLSKLDYYFLFSPTCRYCKKMSKNIVNLPNLSPLQVTGNNLVHLDGLPKSSFATSETINTYVKTGQVPVLVIYDNKSKKAKVLKGMKPVSQILNESKKLLEDQ